MVAFIIAVHVIASLGLIAAVLLHSGKGGGLSTAFGGAMPSTFGGTSIIEKNLNRITVTLGVVFGLTSFTLYYITVTQGKL